MKGTKEFSNYLRTTLSEPCPLGPPPINYATHPRRSVLTLGSTSTITAMKVAQSTPAPVPAAPLVYTSCSGSPPTPTLDIDINPELLELILDRTPPSPDAPSFTPMATAASSTLDEQAQTVDLLADALDGLSLATHDTIRPLAAAAITDQRRSKTKYYSVIVGKCCGVFQRW
jgi:hypothetical protein